MIASWLRSRKRATSNNRGSSISARSNETHRSSTPSVLINLPDDTSLADGAAEAVIHLEVGVPVGLTYFSDTLRAGP